MALPYYGLQTVSTPLVENPRNQLDYDYNNYMKIMRTAVKQQKVDAIARVERMKAAAPYTEVNRQLKILNAFPPANREKEEFQVGRRKASWLDEVNKPKTTVPGDRVIEPNGPDDLRHLKEMNSFGQNIKSVVNSRAAGTSRNKHDALVEGSGVYASAREAGVLHPVLGRPEYKVFHQEDVVAEATAGNRSTVTSATWRGQSDQLLPRSAGVDFDTTTGQNRARNVPDANKIMPSFYLTDDGLQLPFTNGSGNAIKKPINNDIVYTTTQDNSYELIDLPPSASVKEKGTDRETIKYQFRTETDSIADRLSARSIVSDIKQSSTPLGFEIQLGNDTTVQAMPPQSIEVSKHPSRVLGYETVLRNDDTTQMAPPKTIDPTKVGSVQAGALVNKDDRSTNLVNPVPNALASALPQAPALPEFAFVPENGMKTALYEGSRDLNQMTMQGLSRAEAPEKARVARDIVNMAGQQQTLGAKQVGYHGGAEMQPTDVYSQQVHDFNASNAMALGARSQHTAAAERSEPVTVLRDAPSAARDTTRVKGKHTFQPTLMSAASAVPKNALKKVQLQTLDLHRGAGMNRNVPMGRAEIQVNKKAVVGVSDEAPVRGSKTITLQQLIMMQQNDLLHRDQVYEEHKSNNVNL